MTAVPAAPEPPASISDDDTAGCSLAIVVCHSCRLEGAPEASPRPGSLLAADTRRAAEKSGITVKQVGCLGNCKRGLSAAILRTGSWTYVFGNLRPDSGADLVTGAQLLASSQDGFMPFRARPESLKRGLIARIPTFGHLVDLP